MTMYFRDVQHQPLRTWNQAVMAFNIRDDEGMESAKEYVAGLTKSEREAVLTLFADIKKRGYEVVRAELNRTMELNPEEEVAE